MVVIGGYNSSNTNHLAHLCRAFTTTYHIADATCIDPNAGTIRHKPELSADAPELTTHDWLPAGPLGDWPLARACWRLAWRSPSFIGAITPSSDTAMATASGGMAAWWRNVASNRGRWASPWPCRALGHRSRVLCDGVMFPNRSKRASPSLGVKCATPQVACWAASGVQEPAMIPARSARGQTAWSPGGCRYTRRSTRTGPAALA